MSMSPKLVPLTDTRRAERKELMREAAFLIYHLGPADLFHVVRWLRMLVDGGGSPPA